MLRKQYGGLQGLDEGWCSRGQSFSWKDGDILEMGFVTATQFKDGLKGWEKGHIPLIQAHGRQRQAELCLRTKHNSSSNNNWLRL